MTRIAMHPGKHLAERLRLSRLSANRLALAIEVPPNRVTAILHGTRAVTADTALRLGHCFGVRPEFWLSLQVAYDLRVTRERRPRRRKIAAPIRAGRGREHLSHG